MSDPIVIPASAFLHVARALEQLTLTVPEDDLTITVTDGCMELTDHIGTYGSHVWNRSL